MIVNISSYISEQFNLLFKRNKHKNLIEIYCVSLYSRYAFINLNIYL